MQALVILGLVIGLTAPAAAWASDMVCSCDSIGKNGVDRQLVLRNLNDKSKVILNTFENAVFAIGSDDNAAKCEQARLAQPRCGQRTFASEYVCACNPAGQNGVDRQLTLMDLKTKEETSLGVMSNAVLAIGSKKNTRLCEEVRLAQPICNQIPQADSPAPAAPEPRVNPGPQPVD